MRKNGVQTCTLFNMTLLTVCSVTIDSFLEVGIIMPMQVKTKLLVCATSWQNMTRRVPQYVYDNLQQTADAQPIIVASQPPFSFIHTGTVHESTTFHGVRKWKNNRVMAGKL